MLTELDNATYVGVLFGMRLAEQINGLKANATALNDRHIDYLREIADGNFTLIESGAEMRKVITDEPNLEQKLSEGRVNFRKIAATVLRCLYDQG